jgi:hypothetical protein
MAPGVGAWNSGASEIHFYENGILLSGETLFSPPSKTPMRETNEAIIAQAMTRGLPRGVGRH